MVARQLLLWMIMACGALMLGPVKPIADLILPSDWSAHIVALFCVTSVLSAAYPAWSLKRTWAMAVFLGVSLELAQGLMGRDLELSDILANTVGASLALAPLVISAGVAALLDDQATSGALHGS